MFLLCGRPLQREKVYVKGREVNQNKTIRFATLHSERGKGGQKGRTGKREMVKKYKEKKNARTLKNGSFSEEG